MQTSHWVRVSNAMQLNDPSAVVATIMAASEPPEPPPRNPDKINASLKQIVSTESVRASDGQAFESMKQVARFGFGVWDTTSCMGNSTERHLAVGNLVVKDRHLVDNWF